MTLQASGAISLSQVNTELGLSATAQISLNDSAVRTLFAVASGAIAMSNGYGKSNRTAIAITISANTQNYLLNTAKATGYVAGNSDVTLTINSGVFVGSSSTAGIALDVNTSWAAGDTVKIVNNGVILGCGGAGGTGSGGAGAAGGPALRVQRATSVQNNGSINGGGGGGGGGGYFYGGNKISDTSGGGGGGGGGYGYSGGAGGAGGAPISASSMYTGFAGGAGTTSAGGGGGAASVAGGGAGGAGGSFGATGTAGVNSTNLGSPTLGGSGGAGGNCTTSGSNALITWLATGTRNGTIA